MKKSISAILIILLVSSLLIACSDKPSRTNKNDDEEIELTTSNIDDLVCKAILLMVITPQDM